MMLDAVLRLAQAGLAVFPLHRLIERDGTLVCGCAVGVRCSQSPGKHPVSVGVFKKGFHSATTDVGLVADAWSIADYNIGAAIPTGCVVLDPDGEQGERELAQLHAELGPLPPTVEVITGRGRHLWYRHRRPVEQTALAPKLDVRVGGKGYVVVPPSLHESGKRYRWKTNGLTFQGIPFLPDAWESRLTRRETGVRRLQQGGTAILDGERNTALASVAGSLRRIGLDEEELAASLLVINDRRCRPPLERDEVERIAHSISRYDTGLLEGVVVETDCLICFKLTNHVIRRGQPVCTQCRSLRRRTS